MVDILIPDDACVRVTFESAVSTFFGKLAEQLQTNAEGVFFIHQDPLARQGCRPFHIKLIASNNLAGISYQTISGIMCDVGLLCQDAKGYVLPVCVVDSKGLVSLKVSSPDCVLIGKRISQLLFDSNGWRPEYEVSLLVNIGTFHGPHRSAFEAWLNGELRSNSSAFPPFRAEYLEISNRCGNLLEGQVRLSQGSCSPDTRPVINDKQDTSNHASKCRDFESILDSSKLKEQLNRKKLLGLAKPITDKMRGVGIVKALDPMTYESKSKLKRYSITPVELSHWHSDCRKIMSVLDQMLQIIGPKEFLNVLDSVSNLNSSESLSSALLPQVEAGRGRCLVLTRIIDLHIEAMSNHESSGMISSGGNDLDGAFISLSIGNTIKPTETHVEMNKNPDPVPVNFDTSSRELVCFLSSGNQTLADSRAQHLKPPPPNRALIALYVNSVSLNSLDLQPYNGRSEFYLPIVWIDIRDKIDQNGMPKTPCRSIVNDRQKIIEPAEKASSPTIPFKCADAIKREPHVHSFSNKFYGSDGRVFISTEDSTNMGHGHGQRQGEKQSQGQRHHIEYARSQSMPQQHLLRSGQGSGQGVFHVGDWICPACKAWVFSFRPDCFRCCTLRPDTGPHIVPRQPKKTTLRPEGDVREGDWNCLSCKGHNFADKLACFTCRAPKPQAAIGDYQQLECSQGDERACNETNTILSKCGGLEAAVGTGSLDAGIEGGGGVVTSPKAPQRFLRSMPGDWTCGSCNEIVFAKRYRCYKCSALRIR